jgi:hypothetical protein
METKLDLMEEAVALSSYHFDKTRFDPRFDAPQSLGRFEGDWASEVADAIAKSKTRSFETRNVPEGQSNFDDPNVSPEAYGDLVKSFRPFEQEFFDKTDLDYKNYPIINKTNDAGPTIKAMFEAFKLTTPSTYTIHIQKAGQVFPYHIDFFHRRRWKDCQQDKVIRIVVHLNDWQPGQCMGYGNGVHTHWQAGDFHTFDHASVPHWTANATYEPRVSLLITGVKTAETEEFLYKAKTSKAIKI